MPVIDSPQNRVPKLLRALHTKKGREEFGLALVEGPKVVGEALAAGRLAFVAWCPETADEDSLRSILRAVEAAGVPVHELAPRAFAATADTVTPTGLLGVAGLRWLGLAELEVPDRAKWLVLCDVRDPGNAGTMIRSADAFGVSAVLSLGHCVDLYEPKVVRATAGAVFHLPLARCEWPELRAWAADKGIATVATDLGGKVSLLGRTGKMFLRDTTTGETANYWASGPGVRVRGLTRVATLHGDPSITTWSRCANTAEAAGRFGP